jgi:hypothetical protein
MRLILTILLFLLLALPAACASDGDDSKSAMADPLVAAYHGALLQALTEESKAEALDEEQPGQTAEAQQRTSKTELMESGDEKDPTELSPSNGLNVAQTDELRPWLALEPRHQSLINESSPLPDKSAQRDPGQEQAAANQTNQGDPLLGTYYRQIPAAPLSDDLALNANTNKEGPSEKPKPRIGSKIGIGHNQNQDHANKEEESQLRASLQLEPANRALAPEIKPAEQYEDEPSLVNPPEHTGPSQIWIEQVGFIEAKGQIIIEIQLNGRVSPKIYILDEDGDRPRLVMDFPGVTGRGFPRRIGAPPSVAIDIRMANYPENARVIVGLIPHKHYEVQPAWLKGQNKLLISVALI